MIKILKKGNNKSRLNTKICYNCHCVFTFNPMTNDTEVDLYEHKAFVRCPQCGLRLNPYTLSDD